MHEVYAVVAWHFHKTPRVYFDVIVQLADDAAFTKNARAIFNNDNDNTTKLGAGQDMNYVETSEGKLIDAKGALRQGLRASEAAEQLWLLTSAQQCGSGPGVGASPVLRRCRALRGSVPQCR